MDSLINKVMIVIACLIIFDSSSFTFTKEQFSMFNSTIKTLKTVKTTVGLFN